MLINKSLERFEEPTPKEIIMEIIKDFDSPIIREFDFELLEAAVK